MNNDEVKKEITKFSSLIREKTIDILSFYQNDNLDDSQLFSHNENKLLSLNYINPQFVDKNFKYKRNKPNSSKKSS